MADAVTQAVTLTVQSTLLSEIGVYEFTFLVNLQDQALADASYAVHTATFPVFVLNPCDETVIDAIALDPVVTSLEIILPFPVTGSDKVGIPFEPEDSASQNYGAADGY